MINPAQAAIELVLLAVALVVARSVGGAGHRRFVLAFAAAAALANLGFYGIAVWPLYLEAAATQGIDLGVFRAAVVFETLRWGVLALVLSRVALKLQDAGLPGGFAWRRGKTAMGRVVAAGVLAGVVTTGAMFGLSLIQQRLGYFDKLPWPGAYGEPIDVSFAIGAGLRNLVGEEAFARLGAQSIALYLLRNVRGGAILSIAASALIFELWHNPFERPLFLNFTGSAIFGWAYHRHGYEAAAVAHCVADWLLLAAVPLLFLR